MPPKERMAVELPEGLPLIPAGTVGTTHHHKNTRHVSARGNSPNTCRNDWKYTPSRNTFIFTHKYTPHELRHGWKFYIWGHSWYHHDFHIRDWKKIVMAWKIVCVGLKISLLVRDNLKHPCNSKCWKNCRSDHNTLPDEILTQYNQVAAGIIRRWNVINRRRVMIGRRGLTKAFIPPQSTCEPERKSTCWIKAKKHKNTEIGCINPQSWWPPPLPQGSWMAESPSIWFWSRISIPVIFDFFLNKQNKWWVSTRNYILSGRREKMGHRVCVCGCVWQYG